MNDKFKIIHRPIVIPNSEWGDQNWHSYMTESLCCAIRSWKYFYEARSGLNLSESSLKDELLEIYKLLDKHFKDNPKWNTPMPPKFVEMNRACFDLWKNHVNRKSDSKPAEKLKKQPLPKLKIVKKSLSEVLGGD